MKLKFSSFILLEKCKHGFLQAHYVCNMRGFKSLKQLVHFKSLFCLYCTVLYIYEKSDEFYLNIVNINIHKPCTTTFLMGAFQTAQPCHLLPLPAGSQHCPQGGSSVLTAWRISTARCFQTISLATNILYKLYIALEL